MFVKAPEGLPEFDPYFAWLKIPEGMRPPTIYQLLAIEPEEWDSEKIRKSAAQREALVRKSANGPQKAFANTLLYEIQEARVTLLNDTAREKYDSKIDTIYERQRIYAREHGFPLEGGGHKPVGEESGLLRRFLWIVGIIAIVLTVVAVKNYQHFRNYVNVASDQQSNAEASPDRKASPPVVAAAGVAVPAVSVPAGVPAATSTAQPSTSNATFAKAPFDEASAKRIQAAAAESVGQPVLFTNSINMQLRLIPAGEFQMGSSESVETLLKLVPPPGNGKQWDAAADKTSRNWILAEMPAHKVRITKPFYLGRCEVTQKEWADVMGPVRETLAPQFSKGDRFPVPVTWDAANEYCRKLSEKEGQTYRLPTEAEWEYACRAGTTTRYYFGDDAAKSPAYAWNSLFKLESNDKTQLVGMKLPNSFGLHDMHGNLREWCSDRYDMEYYAVSPTDDPPGSARDVLPPGIDTARKVQYRVTRGGGASAYADWGRSANRDMSTPLDHVGFRVVRVIAPR